MNGFSFQWDCPTSAVLLACAFGCLVVIWAFVQAVVLPWRRLMFYRKQGLKGPSFRPVVGNILELQKFGAPQHPTTIDEVGVVDACFPHLVHWARKYAPGQQRLLYQALTATNIVLWDAGLVREFFTKHSFYELDHATKVLMEQFAGKGLVVLHGDMWAGQRKLLNPGFRIQFLKKFHEYMVEAANEVLQVWLQSVQQGNGSAEILINKELKKATMDIIARAVFGGGEAGSIPAETGTKIFEALDEIIMLAPLQRNSVRFALPALGFLLPKTEIDKKTAKQDAFITSLLQEMVDARIAAVESTYGKGSQAQSQARDSEEILGGHDMMGLMVDAMLRGSETMTRKQVAHECRTLFVGGQSTTTALVAWTLLLLAHHPEWQDKAREEVAQVTGSTGVIDAQNIEKLRILGMILNEAIRLYPSVSILGREAIVRHKLGDLDILPGTNVFFNIPLLQLCGKYWDDPLAFRPDRFEKGVAAATLNKADAFVPFSGGPRVCIGQNFATMVAKTLVGTLLSRLRFRVSPKYQHMLGCKSTLAGSFRVLLEVEELEPAGR